MSLLDKVDTLKEIITLICGVIPEIISLIKEVVIVVREIKTTV